MENQELESTIISNGNGNSARKWFVSLQIHDRQVAESLRVHKCDGAGIVRRRGGGGRRWRHGQDKSSKAIKNFKSCGGTTFAEDQACPGQRNVHWCGRKTEAGTMQHVQGSSRIWSVRRLCVTCSKGLDTDYSKPFWLCLTGIH